MDPFDRFSDPEVAAALRSAAAEASAARGADRVEVAQHLVRVVLDLQHKVELLERDIKELESRSGADVRSRIERLEKRLDELESLANS